MYKSLCCLVVIAFLALAEVPTFQSVDILKANDSPIQARYGCGAPWVLDWDGDGKKDLLMGHFWGDIRLYLNSGTNTAPVLTDFTLLKADGKTLEVYGFWCIGSVPQAGDLNGDGIEDLVVGDRNGVVHYYSKNSSGDLHFEEKLKANGSEIKYDYNSCPALSDWNEDGLLDLLLSCEYGSNPIRLYLNSGTKTQYKFTGFTSVKAGGNEIKNHFRCMITVGDLNKDGKKDLLVGDNSSKIYFYENKGTNAEPELANKVALKAGGSEIKLNGDTRQCIIDWNEDGAYDLVAGEYNNNIYLILGTQTTDIAHDKKPVHAKKPLVTMLSSGYCSITMELEHQQDIAVTLFSSSGKILRTVNHSGLSEGKHNIQLDLNTFPKGVYFLQADVNNMRETSRLIYAE